MCNYCCIAYSIEVFANVAINTRYEVLSDSVCLVVA